MTEIYVTPDIAVSISARVLRQMNRLKGKYMLSISLTETGVQYGVCLYIGEPERWGLVDTFSNITSLLKFLGTLE